MIFLRKIAKMRLGVSETPHQHYDFQSQDIGLAYILLGFFMYSSVKGFPFLQRDIELGHSDAATLPIEKVLRE